MNWKTFWDSVGSFFSDVGSIFLANIKAAIPVVEQAAINLLEAIATVIITDIETGVIPLPVLAVSPGAVVDSLALGKVKRDIAYAAIQAKLATTTLPEGIVITDSLVYFTIELSVQKYKVANSGNQGNFPGGNSGPASV